jgi:hypothetical protein
VREQRERYRPQGIPLPPWERRRLRGFFSEERLGSVQLCKVAALPNPILALAGADPGSSLELDFGGFTGLTLIDTILVAEPRLGSPARLTAVLFQELVHVCQYALLGVDAFLDAYVTGWLEAAGDYDRIPLERQAEALRQRFDDSPVPAFAVEQALGTAPLTNERNAPR